MKMNVAPMAPPVQTHQGARASPAVSGAGCRVTKAAARSSSRPDHELHDRCPDGAAEQHAEPRVDDELHGDARAGDEREQKIEVVHGRSANGG